MGGGGSSLRNVRTPGILEDSSLYSYGQEHGSAGSNTYVEVRFQRFSLGPVQPNGSQELRIRFEASVNARGASSGGESFEPNSGRISFSVNDIPIETDADKFFQDLTYTIPSKVTKITITRLRIRGDSNIAAGPAKTPWGGPDVQNLDPFIITDTNSNLTLVTNPTTAVAPKIIRLPPATPAGKMQIIKIKSGDINSNSGYNHNVWIYPNNGENIENGKYNWYYSGLIINYSRGACILVSTGSGWSIVQYYWDSADWSSFENGNYLYASIGVNEYRNTTSTRGNTDYTMILPSPGGSNTGKMLIVVYSPMGYMRWLRIRAESGIYIDNRTADSGTVWIGPPNGGEAGKTSGIVFISGGDTWYILGHTESPSWVWDNTISAVNTEAAFDSSDSRVNITGDTNGRDYILPFNLTSYPNNTTGRIVILKNNNISNNSPAIVYKTNAVFNPIPLGTDEPLIGENTKRIYWTGFTAYMCTWFIGYRRSGENRIRWFPILNYLETIYR